MRVNKQTLEMWLLETMAHQPMTMRQINQRWVRSCCNPEGLPLSRQTLCNYLRYIAEDYGVEIECRRSGHEMTYKFDAARWRDANYGLDRMMGSFAMARVMNDWKRVAPKVMFGECSKGMEYMATVVETIASHLMLTIVYRPLGSECEKRYTVRPLGLRCYKLRWYLVCRKDNGEMRTLALDRFCSIEVGDEWSDEADENFDVKGYFADYVGLFVDPKVELRHIVVRAEHRSALLLKAQPIHHSQREEETTADYTLFGYDLRPTQNFYQELMWYGRNIDIIAPTDVRQKIMEMRFAQLRVDCAKRA
ncbi:MAG: WYL domain-containing protein [Bacteroidaceae bacterium]|nr:WYL domain-containing protein [Bacteroidaceae bacterium]